MDEEVEENDSSVGRRRDGVHDARGLGPQSGPTRGPSRLPSSSSGLSLIVSREVASRCVCDCCYSRSRAVVGEGGYDSDPPETFVDTEADALVSLTLAPSLLFPAMAAARR